MAFDPVELGFVRILRDLDRDQIMSFLDSANAADVPADTVLTEQGDEDDAMVIILAGTLEVYLGHAPYETIVRHAHRGETLGELALLGLTAHRSASIRTISDCALLILERPGYETLRAAGHPAIGQLHAQVLHSLAARVRETNRQIGMLSVGHEITLHPPAGLWNRLATAVAGSGPRGRAPSVVDVLKVSPHFLDLSEPLRRLIADQVEVVAKDQGEHIIKQGSMRGDAWIVATGEVGAYRRTQEDLYERVGTLNPGALFGHLAIINDDTRTATCVTECGCWLYRMPREIVKALLVSSTREGEALRRCFIHALSDQLEPANTHLLNVSARHTATLLEQRAALGALDTGLTD